MSSMDDLSNDESLEYLVLDATDAFWNVPLHPSERRFYTGKLGSQFLVYLRTAQGSRGAPLSWSAVFGLACRLVQSLFFVPGSNHKVPFDAIFNIYVDDPLVILRGCASARRRLLSLIVLTWRVLGIQLAFTKAQYGTSIDWIGWSLHLQLATRSVSCVVRQERLSELAWLSEQILSGNTVSIKSLRTYTGKCQSMASLLYTWRPFISMLWAALYDTSNSLASRWHPSWHPI